MGQVHGSDRDDPDAYEEEDWQTRRRRSQNQSQRRGGERVGLSGPTKANVVVLDNGGGWCKAGFAGKKDPDAIVPNCVARPQSSRRWLVADQITQCDDIQRLGIRRPMDRGYLIYPDLQKEIWDRTLKTLLHVQPSKSSLLLVEPLFTLPSIQKITDELVFEDLGFQSLFVADAPSLAHLYMSDLSPHGILARSGCSLIVDCGFSFTHAAPVVNGFTCNAGVKRIDLGGKALTNYLKELVSYRSVNMLDETWIMEDVKEKLCYTSLDVTSDMEIARKSGKENYIRCDYVLPDGVQHKRGMVKDPDAVRAAYRHLTESKDVAVPMQTIEEALPLTKEKLPSLAKDIVQELTVTNERFLVPEMLFHPSDIGINQAGLAECITRAVSSCHPDLHPFLYSSVVLTGGTTKFPGFKERLEMELRPLVPAEYKLNVHAVDDPILAPWRGGSLLAARPDFESCSITKAEYEELGSYRCRQRFMRC